MTAFPLSPRLLKGGIVLVDPESGQVKRIITVKYNPDTLSRTLQVKGVGKSADRSEALRLKGPPVETIKLEAEIDATDQSDSSAQNPKAVQLGIQPRLAALRLQPKPLSTRVFGDEDRTMSGTSKVTAKEAMRVRLTAARLSFPCPISGTSNPQSNSIKAEQIDNIIQIQHQL